jgi:hypothetical protein
MNTQRVLLYIKEEQIGQLWAISTANNSYGVAAEHELAIERYLALTWEDFGQKVIAWHTELHTQKLALFAWLSKREPDATSSEPQPVTDDIRYASERIVDGGQPTWIKISDEHLSQLQLFAAYFHKPLWTIIENAFQDYIQAEMLDDPDTFQEKVKKSNTARARFVERFLDSRPHH